MKLFDYIDKDCVLFDQTCANWEDAIELAGNLLIKKDFINEQYKKDMVELVKKCGAYIVVMPGVALSHARPNGNVSKNSISVVTFKDGVCFGHKENDPVKLLFAIAAVNDDEHLKLFQSIADYLIEPKNLEKMLNAKTYEEMKEC